MPGISARVVFWRCASLLHCRSVFSKAEAPAEANRLASHSFKLPLSYQSHHRLLHSYLDRKRNNPVFRDINLGGDGLATKTKRPYLYEVDLMRVIFIFGVLLNHTTTVYMAHIVNTSNSQTFLEATHLILHFTRMGFMFMSGLVLTLNYYNREPHWVTFWKKRFSSSGIPYLAWDASFMGISSTCTTFWSPFSCTSCSHCL